MRAPAPPRAVRAAASAHLPPTSVRPPSDDSPFARRRKNGGFPGGPRKMTPPQTRGARSVRPGAMASASCGSRPNSSIASSCLGSTFTSVSRSTRWRRRRRRRSRVRRRQRHHVRVARHRAPDPRGFDPRGGVVRPRVLRRRGIGAGRAILRGVARREGGRRRRRARGRTLAFRVGLCLPPGMPPSFRGAVARYAYAVTFVATTGATASCTGCRCPWRRYRASPTEEEREEEGDGDSRRRDPAGLGGPWAPRCPRRRRDTSCATAPTRLAHGPAGRRRRRALSRRTPRSPAVASRSPTRPAAGVAGQPARRPQPRLRGGGVGSPASCGLSPFGRAAPATAPAAAYAIALDDGSRLLRVIPRAPTPRCVAGRVPVALDFGTG